MLRSCQNFEVTSIFLIFASASTTKNYINEENTFDFYPIVDGFPDHAGTERSIGRQAHRLYR